MPSNFGKVPASTGKLRFQLQTAPTEQRLGLDTIPVGEHRLKVHHVPGQTL
jgi:hypothetical protein